MLAFRRVARWSAKRFQHLLGINRFADQETLHEIAFKRRQMLHLRFGLDALAYHLQAEIMGKQDDGVQHHRAALVLDTGQQEGAVHLERIERQAAQI